MNTYRRDIDGSTVNESVLRREAKAANRSLPKVLGAAEFTLLAIDPILRVPKPAASNVFKIVHILAQAEQDGNGNWVQAYEEVDKFTEYLDDQEPPQPVTVIMQEATLVETTATTVLGNMSFNAEMDLKDGHGGTTQYMREAQLMMQVQARSVKGNNTTNQRALAARAAALGISVSDMADQIVAVADGLEDIAGAVLGKLDLMRVAVAQILATADTNLVKMTALKALTW